MPYLLVHYSVRNYKRWRKVFDPDTVPQRAAGAHVRYALQDAKDPNHISILAYIDDPKRLDKLMRRKNLPELIKKAGVLLPTVRYRWLKEEP